jgi:TonB-dependent receptor
MGDSMKNQNNIRVQTFRRTLLATAVASTAVFGFSGAAFAQDDAEEIVVTGIKASLQNAMNIKREAAGVVDAISSEDMGKMPDSNLAESLQRITGISIDRNNGEGSRVTARGFGADYNLVLLNGRQMPTSSGTSRSYDFSNIASEGISGAQVYKTSKADVAAGGIGATINIQTARPLDKPGFNASVGGKALKDTSSFENSDPTPEVSGIVSNTFNDDKIGVLLSGSYQERNSGSSTAKIGGWRSHYGVWDKDWDGKNDDWTALDNNTSQINRPQGETNSYSIPQSLIYNFNETQRKRTNGQLVLQFKPIETLTTTLDYTYAQQEIAQQFTEMSAWFGFGGQKSSWTKTDAANPVGSPLYYTEDNAPNGTADRSYAAGDFASIATNNSVGFNAKWDVTDELEVVLDVHHSDAESKPNSPLGSNNVLSTASFTRAVTTADFTHDFPILTIGSTAGKNFTDDVTPTGSVFGNNYSKMVIDQAQLKGTYKFDDSIIKSVNFGVSMIESENHAASATIQHDTWGGVDPAYQGKANPNYAASIWTKANNWDRFGNVDGGTLPRSADYLKVDFKALLAAETKLNPHTGKGSNGGGDCGTGYCMSSDFSIGNDRYTTETIDSGYIQGNFSTEVLDMPLNAAVGVRYESTDVLSKALTPNYSGGLIWAAANEVNLPPSTSSVFTQDEGTYNNTLPSVDLDLGLTDDIKLRVSGGKSISRANYEDLQGGLTVNSPARTGGGTGSQGNAALLPLESTNFDISAEWYIDSSSYASIGYFHKSVDNFIGHGKKTITAFNLPSATFGPLYKEALAAVGSGADDIRNYIFKNHPNDPGVDVAAKTITGIAGRDGFETFEIGIPVNQKKAMLQGYEFAIQKTFETGFGGQLNYTIVSGDIKYDNNLIGAEQFALLGLSDSYNAIAFYEKDGIHARIAYNWRDEFLAGTGQDNVGANNPTYVDAYGQVDANISYDVNESLTVMLEGTNITNQYGRTHGRSAMQTLNVFVAGPRYDLGVRYKF